MIPELKRYLLYEPWPFRAAVSVNDIFMSLKNAYYIGKYIEAFDTIRQFA